MALFELDNGRLVPAQFGHEVPGGFTDSVLETVRSQVLEIVSRPLFPITWSPIGNSNGSGSQGKVDPRLTALDASGQVVAVEVVEYLDAEVLIDSLSKLANTAAMSWTDLAREFPDGPEGFRREWVIFRDAMPPSPPNGPRLILVAAKIAGEVRPALDVLSSSGVEVHEMSLRQMSNGRAFLEVDAVGPRLYGHSVSTLLETADVLPALDAARTGITRGEEPARHGDPVSHKADIDEDPATSTGAPVVVAKRSELPERLRRRRAQLHRPPASTLSQGIPVRPMPSRRDIHVHTQDERTRILQRDPVGLAAIAEFAGTEIRIALGPGLVTPRGSQLTADGWVEVPAGRFSDPSAALRAEGFVREDGWKAWHLGDEYGPTLEEALQEINHSRT